MLDIRSTLRKVNSEQRKYPRLELQCKAVVRGYNGIFTITDISLGGLFIERQGALIVKIGQVTDIRVLVGLPYFDCDCREICSRTTRLSLTFFPGSRSEIIFNPYPRAAHRNRWCSLHRVPQRYQGALPPPAHESGRHPSHPAVSL